MKKNRKASVVLSESLLSKKALIILMIFFIVGIFAGAFVTRFPDENSFFSENIRNVISNGIKEYSIKNTFFNYIKYPLFILIFGITPIGVLLIPLSVATKGFFLSASVCSTTSLLGMNGFYASFLLLAVQSALSIPIIMLSALLGLNMSFEYSAIFSNKKRSFQSTGTRTFRYICLFIIIMTTALLFSLIDTSITPFLFSNIAKISA